MISEGSYDTEDWSVGFWKFTFAIKGWNKHFTLKQKTVILNFYNIYNITLIT